MLDLSRELNEKQIEAVTTTEGAVLVMAGPGSGKTRVLTFRIAYIIEQLRVSPYNILAITFTNKAANEMKDRLQSLIPDYASGVWVSTFHAMCRRILNSHIDKLGYDRNYTIYDDKDSERVIKRICDNKHLEQKKGIVGVIKHHIGVAKTKALNPEQYRNVCTSYDAALICDVYEAYESELISSNALDFNDLLLKTLELFVKFPEVVEIYQRKFRYILVDEFQDTNHIQYILVRLLAMGFGNVFAVGDEDQSIYGWRGADVGNIYEFRKDFPGAITLSLTQNYRSSESIVEAANALIKNNRERIGKVLDTKNGKGQAVDFYTAFSDREEAEYVAFQIVDLVKRGVYTYKDFAVLVRANALTRQFEERFRDYNIAHRVFGGQKFYDRKEVKDVLAYLKILVNPRDNESLLRIINFPQRGIGDKLQEALLEVAAENGLTVMDVILRVEELDGLTNLQRNKIRKFRDIYCSLFSKLDELSIGDYAKYVVESSGIRAHYTLSDKPEDEGRLENVEELVAGIYEFEKVNPEANLADYMQSVSLSTDSDNIKNDDVVTIATIHSVKGLEFNVVFVVALEENVFPSFGATASDREIEEERRVMYVAVTRAIQRLYLLNASSRFRYNITTFNPESRFLKEIKSVVYKQGQQSKVMTTFRSSYKNANNSRGKSTEKIVGFVPRMQETNTGNNYNANVPIIKQSKATHDAKMYKVGQRVKHAKFGDGTIAEINGEVGKVQFEGLGVKILNLTLAPLTPVEE